MFNLWNFGVKLVSNLNIIHYFKIMYGTFFKLPNGQYEYYLKLDGYYFCEKNYSIYVIIKVRNKRFIDKLSVQALIQDKEYLKELHPADICILGIIANNERNGLYPKKYFGIKRVNLFKEYDCFIKTKPILYISKKFSDELGNEISVLRSIYFKKEIKIPTLELYQNQALLYALTPLEAIALGYDVSEIFIHHSLN